MIPPPTSPTGNAVKPNRNVVTPTACVELAPIAVLPLPILTVPNSDAITRVRQIYAWVEKYRGTPTQGAEVARTWRLQPKDSRAAGWNSYANTSTAPAVFGPSFNCP